ncbi:MAG: polyribonucleotide nucleotidyltransferase [Nitrospina sp.]|jgi:polyribonucleotide nucleotidyltransferase|nr:polyribonucleotide nucleotidyltransferase [Nitrospina sp.]MBT3877059.1 polyribonucleotide nucleotidyltransferase [Nitrospina sp.]MBT4048330.1 polyribonucleotide nucleotidyltransferase [Nitrospina sp.]MBT4558225.1 polyribonucleotide nucleotidyltransferase [Nitrospina sp.]MBT5348542.1 polyribonucleotide nucleotidyltransferase [Nitrospina sp.]
MEKVEIDIDGKLISLEAGDLARQAGGAVVVRQGDTMLLVTATMANQAREGIDFFPLTVDYREKTYAAGKIPGSFFRREARPGDIETLTCRLIDRPIRPLFPKSFKNETQVVALVISHDQVNAPDINAITGASAALMISEIPFETPVAGARISRVDGKLIFNPTYEETAISDLNLVMAGTLDGIVMVEAGAEEVSEDDMMEALDFGHERIKKVIGIQIKLRELLGKEKIKVEAPQVDEELKSKIHGMASSKLSDAMQIAGKHERSDAIKQIREDLKSSLSQEDQDEKAGEIKEIFHDLEKDIVRNLVLDKQYRVDGRGLADVRAISIKIGYLPRVHGSAVFTRGETQALVSSTLGTSSDEQRIDSLEFKGTKSFFLHYNFPAFCTGEVKFIAGPGRREVGHGMLAERALIPVLPDKEKFPYTIRIVSDILESNGSSSMASVCGGSLSMMDAGVPIKAPVAGIAMGLIKDGDRVAILSDILGSEDHLGDMDFKVAGTPNGITALQMDIKVDGLDRELMSKALEQAKAGRLHILGEMDKALTTPREEMSKYAPRIVQITVPKDKIRDVIGPGGKVIREIIDKTGVSIDINDDGVVSIASADEEAAKKAVEFVQNLVQEVEVGKIYLGKVKKIVDFGAFVEIFPGTDGLVHISQICDRRIKNVSDEIQEGDEIKVKVIDVDQQGRVKLSRKEALRDGVDGVPAAE